MSKKSKTKRDATRLFGLVLMVALVGAMQSPVGSGDHGEPSEEPGFLAPACPAREPVEGVGLACMTKRGALEVFTADDRSLGTMTHPTPRGGGPSALSSHDLPDPRTPRCVDAASDTFYADVFYARPHDLPDDYQANVDMIRGLVEEANGYVYEAGLLTGRVVDLRVACETDPSTGEVVVRVSEAVLPTDAGQADAASIIADMRNLGHDDWELKYWVWYDDTMGGFAGQAHWIDDDRPGVDNPSNGNAQFSMFSLTYKQTGASGARTMLHELSHTMGAVQLSAPNTSGFGHCIDGRDVMCYNDGGWNGANYTTTVCPDRIEYDCNKDDYFNAYPGAGSYLDQHWNLASSIHRFIERGGAAPPMDLAAQGGPDPKEISLSWDASPTPSAFVDGYEIHRQPGCSGGFILVTTVPDTQHSFVDSGLGDDETHCYRAITVSSGLGDSPFSSTASATTFRVPDAVENLEASPGGLFEIALRWDPPLDDGGMAVTMYVVYRTESPADPTSFQQVATVAAPGPTEFTDSFPPVEYGSYHYQVTALNPIGEGPVALTTCSKPFPWVPGHNPGLCGLPP